MEFPTFDWDAPQTYLIALTAACLVGILISMVVSGVTRSKRRTSVARYLDQSNLRDG